jgi:hypothetical protein
MTGNKKCISARRLVFLFACSLFSSNSVSVQYSVQSNVDTRIEYNDNIFLTTVQHNNVTNLSVIPSISIISKEINSETTLSAKLKSNSYTDHSLDSNDVYLDLSSNYNQERNLYSLSGAYNRVSNLNSESTDFGIAGKRVNRNLWTIAPQYQRLLTERLILSADYNHVEVDYPDDSGTVYRGYNTDTVTSSLIYELTENDKLSLVVQSSDYASSDNIFEYTLHVTRAGIEHNFSATLSANISIGASRRDSVNSTIQTLDFFGQPIILPPVSDQSNGFVLDAGITKKFLTSSLLVAASRNDVANSLGGLNEVNAIQFNYSNNITQSWQYHLSARYEKTDAVSAIALATNRETMFLEQRLYHRIDRDWAVNAGYRYVQRKFDSDVLNNETPHSNMVYVSMTYNFPAISTF